MEPVFKRDDVREVYLAAKEKYPTAKVIYRAYPWFDSEVSPHQDYNGVTVHEGRNEIWLEEQGENVPCIGYNYVVYDKNSIVATGKTEIVRK